MNDPDVEERLGTPGRDRVDRGPQRPQAGHQVRWQGRGRRGRGAEAADAPTQDPVVGPVRHQHHRGDVLALIPAREPLQRLHDLSGFALGGQPGRAARRRRTERAVEAKDVDDMAIGQARQGLLLGPQQGLNFDEAAGTARPVRHGHRPAPVHEDGQVVLDPGDVLQANGRLEVEEQGHRDDSHPEAAEDRTATRGQPAQVPPRQRHDGDGRGDDRRGDPRGEGCERRQRRVVPAPRLRGEPLDHGRPAARGSTPRTRYFLSRCFTWTWSRL